MVLLNLLLLHLIPTGWSLPFDSFTLNEELEISKIIHQEIIDKNWGILDPIEKEEFLNDIFKDKEKRISDLFEIPEYFQVGTRFWFKIYNFYSSYHLVIHDTENLNIIYQYLNFKELMDSPLDRYTKINLQSRYAQNQVNIIKKYLEILSDDLDSPSKGAKRILQTIKDSGISIPIKKSDRKEFFLNLRRNIRVQTGQRDMIRRGLRNSRPFRPFIKQTLETFSIPQELLALAFLESSFNPNATSKVGAAGVWQFMPYIGRRMMPMTKGVSDERRNPLIATVAAAHLLKQNFRILKRWDLAITAYNSGTKYIRMAQKELKKTHPQKTMTLVHLFDIYDHSYHGFASRNFYPSFLALTRTLAYKDILFDIKDNEIGVYKGMFNPNKISLYINFCPLNPRSFFNALDKTSPHIRQINNHILNPRKTMPRGSIIATDRPLSKRRYLKLDFSDIKKKWPKNWKDFIKRYKCSTK